MKGILADAQHAVRVHKATPLSSSLALIALGIAVACTAASFSLVQKLNPSTHRGFQGQGIVTIAQSNGANLSPISLELVSRMETESATTSAVAGVFPSQQTFTNEAGKFPVHTELVTHHFCNILKPEMRLGGCFGDGDFGQSAEPTAIVSIAFWTRQLGGRSDVIGQHIRLIGRQAMVSFGPTGKPEIPAETTTDFRIVGVAAPELSGTFSNDTDIWMPYERAGVLYVGAPQMMSHAETLKAVAQLRPGATATSVRTELNEKYHAGDQSLGLAPGSRLDAIEGIVSDIALQRSARRQGLMLFIGSVLLAVVAAANISLFLLSRAPQRQRELGIRAAIGASRGRLVRQLVIEVALLVLAAAVLGVVISIWLSVYLGRLAILKSAELDSSGVIQWQILLLVLAGMLVLVSIVSMAPILSLRRLGISLVSRLLYSRPTFAQTTAQAVQIAIACVLSGVALSFAWYLVVLENSSVGFNDEGVCVISLKAPDAMKAMSQSPDQILVERERIRRILTGVRGVTATTFASAEPGRVTPFVARLPRPNSPSHEMIDAMLVSADYKYPSVLGMTLAYGRELDPGETGSALVNESLARNMWGNTNAVGQLLGQSKMKIVGVLRDAKFAHPSLMVQPMIFRLLTPASPLDAILVKSSLSPKELSADLEQLKAQGQLTLDVSSVEPLADIWSSVTAADRARVLVASASAGLVVFLAALGFYGTLRFLMEAGRREYAIRCAVGAGPRRISRLVLGRALKLGLPGIVIGVAIAVLVVTRLSNDGVIADVPATGVGLLVLITSMLLLLSAALGPMRRAAAVQPAIVLRDE